MADIDPILQASLIKLMEGDSGHIRDYVRNQYTGHIQKGLLSYLDTILLSIAASYKAIKKTNLEYQHKKEEFEEEKKKYLLQKESVRIMNLIRLAKDEGLKSLQLGDISFTL